MVKKAVVVVSASQRVRKACAKLHAEGKLATASSKDIVALAKRSIKDKAARDAFSVFASQVSAVKREFTGGSPTGKPGRPTFESLGIEKEAA